MTPSEALNKLMLADVAEDKATILRYAADEILHPGHAASEECARQVREASNGLLRLASLLRGEASQPLARTEREAAAQVNAAFAELNRDWPGGTLPSPYRRGGAA